MRSLPVFLCLSASAGFRQNCAIKKACRVPFEDRDSEILTEFHTPSDLSKEYPSGHLRPLGHPTFDYLWDGEIPVISDAELNAEMFWTKYKEAGPVLFKGAGKTHPAFKKWTDDNYIVDSFGHYKAKIEAKNEDRLVDYCGQKRLGQKIDCEKQDIKPYQETYMNISKFMSQYRTPEGDKYIISQLPEGMYKDVEVLPAWYCGSRNSAKRELVEDTEAAKRPWMTQLYEANLWINYNEGSNFSSSVMHFDMNHQMMCLYDGEKEWIFFDTQKHIDSIPMWTGYYDKNTGQAGSSDDSPIDGESVDLEKFPQFAQARWQNTTMQPGDCLYLPAFYLHYVRSRGRNIAGMYMFTTDINFDATQCKDKPTQSTPLNEFDIMWDFPGQPGEAGYNKVKMGFPDWKNDIREPLARVARKKGGRIDFKTFAKWYFEHYTMANDEYDKREKKDILLRAKKVFAHVIGKRKQKYFTIKELYTHPLIQSVFRGIGVAQEGDPAQDLDTVLSRFDLTGNENVGKMRGEL